MSSGEPEKMPLASGFAALYDPVSFIALTSDLPAMYAAGIAIGGDPRNISRNHRTKSIKRESRADAR